jgi:hypothetical protein
MKELTMIVVLAFVLFALAVTGLQALDATLPGVVQAREREAAARATQVERQAQIDAREYKTREAAATTAIVIVALGGGVGLAVLAVAGAIGAGRWLNTRARLVQPNEATALFPAILVDGVPVTFNHPGAQIVATMAVARRRPTAAMLDRIMAPPPVEIEPPPPVVEVLPPSELPTVVPVYRADLPQEPALMVGVGARGPVALPLHNLGNVLVGGVPGSGKTECLASMLAGLLRFDASGSTVKVAVVDPKMVDFGAIPNNLQALMWPVAKTVEDAGRLIHAARLEVERRFTLLDAAGARNLAQFNATQVEALPYLVVMVDELADLTGDATFVEHALTIGRKGRAAGVTLVLATQRPSSDVVPSSLRAVCGAQVAFRVLNSRDSATVLGVSGAETLPAVPGRCLVRRSTIETVQAYHADLERRFYPFVGRLPRGDVKQLPAPSVERLPPVATGDDGPILADFSTLHRLPPVEVDATQVERIARGRRPTPAQAAQIRQLHAQGWSANRLSQRFWGYKDSDTLRFIREVLH